MLLYSGSENDVLPAGLRVRKGFASTTVWRRCPGRRKLESYGERWRPYRSVARWYMWRASEIPGQS